MKIQKIKALIPVLAIAFAMTTSAFTASDKVSADSDAVMITGYTASDIPGQPCEKQQNLNCSVTGSEICTVEGKQVYQFLNGTSCFSPLKRN